MRFESKPDHRLNDENLIPLDLYLDDLRNALADAEWEDRDTFRVFQLQKCIDYACAMIDKGDAYMPRF